MFRGKESSNRIELSQLVQDLLNFGVLGSLQLWGGGRWVGGMGVSPHMGTCTYAHICLTSLMCAKCGTCSTLCWKVGNISGSTELFAL